MPYSAGMRKNWRPWAITGGIAEGKSTVLGYLHEAGYRTASADEIAREVFHGPEVLQQIEAAFGTSDRAELRRRLGADAGARRTLNALLHPPTWAALEASEVEVVEVPLLIEAVLFSHFEGVWVVTCGEEEQRRRLRERLPNEDAATQERTIVELLQAQIPTRAKIAFGDRIIHTNLPQADVRREVLVAAKQDFRS